MKNNGQRFTPYDSLLPFLCRAAIHCKGMSRFRYGGAAGQNWVGVIGLADNGLLIDWEIYNRPNRGGLNGFSHFAATGFEGR